MDKRNFKYITIKINIREESNHGYKKYKLFDKRESIKNTLKFIREKDVQQNGSPSHLGLR